MSFFTFLSKSRKMSIYALLVSVSWPNQIVSQAAGENMNFCAASMVHAGGRNSFLTEAEALLMSISKIVGAVPEFRVGCPTLNLEFITIRPCR